ncbi:chitotriosidase-1-like [Haematobia irritans]|uniref:chitotriosidase-1-like n=1 Tax=Haematobia irritans TaxID=7368 RepID=UPI003F50A049
MSIFEILLVMVLTTVSKSIAKDKMINCYLGSWVNDNRPERYTFQPEMISRHCTHVSYAFFGVTHLGSFDESKTYTGPEKDWIERMLAMKFQYPKLKFIAVVGGDMVPSSRLSYVAKNARTRRIFKLTALEALQQMGFDGMDLHWLLPGSSGNGEDKANFVYLLEEIRSGFKENNLLFGITVTGNVTYSHEWYDVPNIVKHVDFINVMSYNYTNDPENDYVAPLRGHSEYSVEKTIDFWRDQGAPATKLNMGLALYARIYTLEDHSLVNVPNFFICAIEKNPPMEFNKDKVTAVIRHVWQDRTTNFIPQELRRISLETIDTLEMKMDYVQKMNLGGVMVWSLENDDYWGICGSKYPLLTSIAWKLDESYICRDKPDVKC